MKPVLTAERLTLSWDGSAPVVRDVSLELVRGEVRCLVGKSGGGKTTVLHALSGLTRPLSGRVLLRGEDVTGRPGRVSYMLQKDLLLPSLRVIDNVALPLVIAGEARASARARAAEHFARFGLADCERAWPSELSGGMRQRAAFLRTYLMGNDAVLLDEPFSALDAITRADLRAWFCGMVAELGLAALVITHDVDEAVGMARKVYVLGGSPGEIVAEVDVDRTGTDRAGAGDFTLTEAYLAAKREVMAAL